MSLSKRERLILWAMVAVACVFFGDRWVLTPLWQQYQVDVDRAAQLERDVLKTRSLLRHRREIEARWQQRQDAGLVAEVSVAEGMLLNHLEKWAGELRLGVSSMKPEREPLKKGAIVQLVRCRLIVSGPMESIAKFCHRLETAAFPVRVELMQISSADPQKDVLGVQFVVSTVNLVASSDVVARRASAAISQLPPG